MNKKIYYMRYFELDFIRGTAILLMVFFHISFDLNNFHFIDINIYHGRDWFYFRMFIVTLFMLSVGISLALANEEKIDLKRIMKRFIILSGASLLVTLASLVTFTSTWIYFGVLHFVTLASLIGVLFVKYDYLSLIIGVIIVTLFNLDIINMHWLFNALQAPLHLPLHTEDLVPFTPWLGVVFIGIFIGKKRLFTFTLPKSRVTHFVRVLGQHSLLIYLAHQPLFFGIIAAADYLLH